MSDVPRLGFAPKFWYGVGQAAEGMKNSSFGFFLLAYYNHVLGLDPLLAGTAALLALVVDAVTDPVTGSISDGWHSRYGRRHPFMYAAALPLGVTFCFVWAPPAGLGQAGLFAWMLTWTVLCRVAMTLYHVPHLALGAELTEDYAERTRVVAYRAFFGFVGGAVLFVVARTVFMRPTAEFPEGQLNAAAYPPMGIAFGVAMAILIAASALGTHARIPYLPRPRDGEEPFSLRRLLRDMRDALRNPSFGPFFAGVFLFFVARGVDQGLGLYVGTFFWKLGSDAVTLPIWGLGGILIGVPIWAGLSRGLDKKPTFMIGIIGFSIFTMLLPVAKLVGFFPGEQHPIYAPLIYFFTFTAAVFGAGGIVASGSMLADVADEHELETGRRQEGIFFGALSFSGKASVGIGTWIAGVALAAIDFPRQAAVADVPAATVTQLALVYGPGVLVLVVIAIVLVSRYDLTRERHAEIRAALDARADGA